MIIHQAYRYELKPNNKQCTLLKQACGISRFVYNWGLEQRNELYHTKQGKDRFTNYFRQNVTFNAIKKDKYPWVYDVPKSVAESALRDLSDAYSNMLRRIENKEKKIGKPKFKKKGIDDHFRISNNSDSTNRTQYDVRLVGNAIRLSKIGWVRTKECTNKCKGRVLNAIINREADRWFCSLVVEFVRPETYRSDDGIIGIDLGIDCFATMVDGQGNITKVQSPKPLRKGIIKIKRLHRKLDQKKKGSHNRYKAQLRLARLYRKHKNIRKDFVSKLTTSLTKTKSVIVIEHLPVKHMMKSHHFARGIGDERWGDFRRMLEYKTKWYGSKMVMIGRFEPTSKTCSECGDINHKLTLNDRIWVCMGCGAVHDRDENAAKNICTLGIKQLNTESSSEIDACGVIVRPQDGAVHDEAGNKHITSGGDKSYGTA